ncbi:MAG: hypothetical protein NTZ68_01180 [Candidatus Dependentiae bacterium]|nr:hypothetical protein [Candidatus Dependentiae bacterium]
MSAEKSGLVDVYGVWYHPWWHSSQFYFFIGTVCFLLALTIIFCVKRYFWGKQKISFKQVALQDLYRLQSQTYISDQAIHEAYFKVTMILKIYLSKRFDISLLDKTDTEIAQQLHGVVPESLEAMLKEFFDRSFQIKFAYDSVSEQMLKDDIEFAQKVIHETSAELSVTEKR